MGVVEPERCPHCKNDMELRALSSFDFSGKKLGCIWFCSFCGHHNIDRFVDVDEGNMHLVKPAISFHEVCFFKWLKTPAGQNAKSKGKVK